MLNRRDAMLRLGRLGLGALALPQLQARAASAVRKKSCIYVFLWGGPPQQDLWDLKPEAPAGIRSPFQPIATSVTGIRISDQMPLLARQMDKVAIIRSLTHPSTVHEPSVYHMLTGKTNPTLVSPRNQRRRSDFPNLAGVVSAFTPPGGLPASVTIPRPIGHDGVTYAGTYAGFLGPRHDPMELREAPNANDAASHPVSLRDELNASRLQARRGLLSIIDAQDRHLQKCKPAEGLSGFQEQAFRMLASPAAKRAFRLDDEPPAVRDRYGRNEYGDSFLLSRRLIEAGVRLVSMIWMYFMPNGRIANVWDNHGGIGGLGNIGGYAMLKDKYCIPPLDLGLSALLDDLAQRGLLDDTMVAVAGEFGRTPLINKTDGRDHWGPCQSVLLAGGGVKGGQVYGASDKIAAYPSDNPVSPEDFLVTIYHGLGIRADAEVHDQAQRPYRIVDGQPIAALF